MSALAEKLADAARSGAEFKPRAVRRRPSTPYEKFLAERARRASVADRGKSIDRDSMHSSLFGFQRDAVQWAAAKGRAGIFAGCGLGESRMALTWADAVADRALIVAPLSVARQMVREAAAIDMDLRYVRDGSAAQGSGVWITNYEMVERFDLSSFGAIVLDECFAAGTRVDTPLGPRPIESIRVGDAVLSAAGADVVWDVHRREVAYCVAVRFGGREVICSSNHPWFTQRGYVGAQDLEEHIAALEAFRARRAA